MARRRYRDDDDDDGPRRVVHKHQGPGLGSWMTAGCGWTVGAAVGSAFLLVMLFVCCGGLAGLGVNASVEAERMRMEAEKQKARPVKPGRP